MLIGKFPLYLETWLERDAGLFALCAEVARSTGAR
jgi:hypothetical protein